MADVTALPSFVACPETPALPPGVGGGIAIARPSPVALGSGAPFALHGAFALTRCEALLAQAHLLQTAVVLLRGPMPATRSVAEGQLLFGDDLIEDGDRICGYFNLDLFSLFNLVREPNRYWVCASIFSHVSGVVTVEVVP